MSTTNCPNCDAIVSYPHGVAQRKCEYCGFVEHVKVKTPRVQRKPVHHSSSSSRPKKHSPNRALGCILPLVVASVVATGIAGFVYQSGLDTNFPPLETVIPGLKTTLPVVMNNNQTIVIENRNEVITGTAIRAANNCEIIIKNSKIKADTLVTTEYNPKITIVNSQIETQNETFHLQGNAKITISAGSIIKSNLSAAIIDRANMKLTIQDSTIVGNRTGIETQNNALIRLMGKSRITGVQTAISGALNTKIEMEGGLIDSPTCAIHLVQNGSLKLHNGSVHGPIAIKAKRNFTLVHGNGFIYGATKGVKKKQIRKENAKEFPQAERN